MSQLNPVNVGSTGLQRFAPAPVGSNSVDASAKSPETCELPTEVSLFTCSLDDALITSVPTDSTLLYEYEPVNVFGSKGFVGLYSARFTDRSRPLWKQCSNVAYCDGPAVFHVPNNVWYDRYQHRWKVLYDGQYFTYGRVDQEQTPVSSIVFPAAYTCSRFSIAFDQNAYLLFACENEGTIEIRREEAGVLTVRSFTGTWPVLFLNALLQQDPLQQDVVCYYLRDGNLYGRWQREEFLTEYLLVENLQATSLRSARADYRGEYPYERLFVMQNCATRILRSANYDFWSIVTRDFAKTGVELSNDGSYSLLVSLLGQFTDSLGASFSLSNDGLYLSTIADVLAPSDVVQASFTLSPNGGSYNLVVVVIPTQSDACVASFSLSLSGGLYQQVVEHVGTFTDAVTAGLTLSNDGSYYT